MRSVVNGDELDEQVLDELEGDLVGAVGDGLLGVRVGFEEEAVGSGGEQDHVELVFVDELGSAVDGLMNWSSPSPRRRSG
mgnify:CR=1 FL=1